MAMLVEKWISTGVIMRTVHLRKWTQLARLIMGIPGSPSEGVWDLRTWTRMAMGMWARMCHPIRIICQRLGLGRAVLLGSQDRHSMLGLAPQAGPSLNMPTLKMRQVYALHASSLSLPMPSPNSFVLPLPQSPVLLPLHIHWKTEAKERG